MIALVLWLLATLDAAFAGYRDAAGRNALINKRRYYRCAMLRGALMGQLAVGVAAFIIGLSLAMSADWRGLLQDSRSCGGANVNNLPSVCIRRPAHVSGAMDSVRRSAQHYQHSDLWSVYFN
jgi:hypothetical protein